MVGGSQGEAEVVDILVGDEATDPAFADAVGPCSEGLVVRLALGIGIRWAERAHLQPIVTSQRAHPEVVTTRHEVEVGELRRTFVRRRGEDLVDRLGPS